ncbi:hypothetical protein BCD67_10755 [Oscillatoriales cyanobacterium USR001]|nr:hypothetical protein BCD67_10755 [Oscillatoriales cyanobacterium USR001]
MQADKRHGSFNLRVETLYYRLSGLTQVQIVGNTNFKKECNNEDPPYCLKKGEQELIKVPLFKGDLGGSTYCCITLENWYKGTAMSCPDYN